MFEPPLALTRPYVKKALLSLELVEMSTKYQKVDLNRIISIIIFSYFFICISNTYKKIKSNINDKKLLLARMLTVPPYSNFH